MACNWLSLVGLWLKLMKPASNSNIYWNFIFCLMTNSDQLIRTSNGISLQT